MADVAVEVPAAAHRRLMPAMHASVFVLGFTLVFVAFWVSIGLVGYALRDNAQYMRQIGGAILVFMGFHLAGVINLGFLNQEHVFSGRLGQRSGFLRSFSLGLIFAAGWTPCVGPVLGAIIGLPHSMASPPAARCCSRATSGSACHSSPRRWRSTRLQGR
jgi:cytochrome c-type biogenesis protein